MHSARLASDFNCFGSR